MSYPPSSGSNSPEQEEPLSATAMFLRSLDNKPEPANESTVKQEQAWPAAPIAPASGAASSGPGEFTRLFQAAGSSPAPQQAAMPSVPSAPPVNAAPATSTAPGEFTRIFQSNAASQEAKTVIEPPPYAAPVSSPAGAPSRKGFSSPGISDSASGEGSLTQVFKPVQAAPVAPPAAPAPPSFAPAAPYAPSAESSWKSEPEFNAHNQPATGPSVTSLLSTLAGSSTPSAARNPEPVPYHPAPAPSYVAPVQQEAVSTPEAGSVTRLIQRLSQTPQEPPPAPSAPVATPVSSEPGEFTKLISTGAFAPAAAPPPPQPAPPVAAAPPPPAMPAFSMPHPQIPHVPHAAAPAPAPAMHLPKVEMPKPVPLPAPPALAAPKGKLEGMVPILLIVNTFLLVLLLVVVLFALKGH